MSAHKDLDLFFVPRGIAILGASSRQGSMGNQVLLNASRMDYTGGLYPINPHAEEIGGLKCYKQLADVDAPVDLVMLLMRADLCNMAVDQIVARRKERGDCGAVIVGSAGFGELATDEGRERQRYLVENLNTVGTRVIGPNCVGVVDYIHGINTTFTGPPDMQKGGVSIISQSGAFGTAFLRWARTLGLAGISKFISVGNMADVSVIELLDYLKDDNTTTSVFVYLEGTTHARELMNVVKEITKVKPVTILKAGRTSMGSQVAQSHTSSVAGNDALYDAAFEQYGIIRADTVSELFNTSRVFDKQPLPKGNKVAIMTVVGGPSIICVDMLHRRGQAKLAKFSEETTKELKSHLSKAAVVGKPDGYIDMTASVTAELHEEILSILMKDDDIDGVIFLTTPPGYIDEQKMCEALIRGYQSVENKKPVLSVLLSGADVSKSRTILEAAGLPTFEYPDDAAVVMSNLIKYADFRRRIVAEAQGE